MEPRSPLAYQRTGGTRFGDLQGFGRNLFQHWLASSLAFRGGTALNKIHLPVQARYSEDIDLVQILAEPVKQTVQELQKALAFLGDAATKPRKDGIQLIVSM